MKPENLPTIRFFIPGLLFWAKIIPCSQAVKFYIKTDTLLGGGGEVQFLFVTSWPFSNENHSVTKNFQFAPVDYLSVALAWADTEPGIT